jgi:nucleoside-diphosphate kinase
MGKEQTFLMIKPDGVQRRLIGTVITRLESKGLQMVALKMVMVESDKAKMLYRDHLEKPFYNKLIRFILSGPIVVSVWEGDEAVAITRKLIGKTDPLESHAGTIRGDLSLNVTLNVVHASDSIDNAQREMSVFFSPAELVPYDMTLDRWMKISD